MWTCSTDAFHILDKTHRDDRRITKEEWMESAHHLGIYEFTAFSDVFQGQEAVRPAALAGLFFKVDLNDTGAISLAELRRYIITTEVVMETKWGKMLAVTL